MSSVIRVTSQIKCSRFIETSTKKVFSYKNQIWIKELSGFVEILYISNVIFSMM